MGWKLPACGAEGVWRQILPRAAGGLRCAPWRGRRESRAGPTGRGRPGAIPGGGGAKEAGPRRGSGVGGAYQIAACLKAQEETAGAGERAWPRVDGLLFTECQGGGGAFKWRESRKVGVACETKEADGLGTNGRGGEWLLRFFPTLAPGLPAFRFLPLGIFLASVLHTAHLSIVFPFPNSFC